MPSLFTYTHNCIQVAVKKGQDDPAACKTASDPTTMGPVDAVPDPPPAWLGSGQSVYSMGSVDEVAGPEPAWLGTVQSLPADTTPWSARGASGMRSFCISGEDRFCLNNAGFFDSLTISSPGGQYMTATTGRLTWISSDSGNTWRRPDSPWGHLTNEASNDGRVVVQNIYPFMEFRTSEDWGNTWRRRSTSTGQVRWFQAMACNSDCSILYVGTYMAILRWGAFFMPAAEE